MRVWFVMSIFIAMTIPGDIGLVQDEGEVHTITVDSIGSNLRFVPDTITVNEGDTIRFLWSGELLPHNAVEQNELFDSGDAMRNVDYTYTFNFNQSGAYEFYCEPHRDLGMIGEITVLDIEQSNVTSESDIESTAGNVDNNDNQKANSKLLVIISLLVIILLYYRTRIDDITRI
tara:strand:- start:775 stop:1296 length:522 start_codon:yes stop_codon:yes gene_type:complete